MNNTQFLKKKQNYVSQSKTPKRVQFWLHPHFYIERVYVCMLAIVKEINLTVTYI